MGWAFIVSPLDVRAVLFSDSAHEGIHGGVKENQLHPLQVQPVVGE